jgi:hypothetical protein
MSRVSLIAAIASPTITAPATPSVTGISFAGGAVLGRFRGVVIAGIGGMIGPALTGLVLFLQPTAGLGMNRRATWFGVSRLSVSGRFLMWWFHMHRCLVLLLHMLRQFIGMVSRLGFGHGLHLRPPL